MDAEQHIDQGWLSMQDYLLQHYTPAAAPGNGVVQLATEEIFTLLQAHCPGEYTKQDLFSFLEVNGFQFRDKGLKFEWLLKKNHASRS